MTLQDWGSVGELVGGIAVIVTLVYLAIQIREYRLGLIASTFHSTTQGFNQINLMLGADPELAEVLERGIRDPESLDAREQSQYVWLQRSYINIYENLYQQYQRGACPAPFWEKFARELKQSLDSPGGRRFRAANNSYEELYAYIDAMPENEAQAYGWDLASTAEGDREAARGDSR